jgi:hypothetical protein
MIAVPENSKGGQAAAFAALVAGRRNGGMITSGTPNKGDKPCRQ